MNPNIKKYVLPNLPYVFLAWCFNKLAFAYRLANGDNMAVKLVSMTRTISKAFSSLLPSFQVHDLIIGLLGAVIIRATVYAKSKNAKKYRHGIEYGSARWGNASDIKPYVDPKPDENVILTQTERLMMNGRPPKPEHARNKNVLVIGGSGSGKTRFFLKPNLMQCHSSYVVTDPKGSVLIECGTMLLRKGYKVKILNTINFSKSMHYNPFAYIRSEKDILKLVTTLMENTKGEDSKGGEDFWVKAEAL